MDKEPIMIDGVDVSWCIELNKRDKVSCYHLLYDKCKDAPNCYFKQLARKTAECEELKKQLETSEKWRSESDLQNTRYRKALEEIEKYLQTQLDGFGNDVYEMQKSAINNIRNIISRAKEG